VQIHVQQVAQGPESEIGSNQGPEQLQIQNSARMGLESEIGSKSKFCTLKLNDLIESKPTLVTGMGISLFDRKVPMLSYQAMWCSQTGTQPLVLASVPRPHSALSLSVGGSKTPG
jgi:hypothetical protein